MRILCLFAVSLLVTVSSPFMKDAMAEDDRLETVFFADKLETKILAQNEGNRRDTSKAVEVEERKLLTAGLLGGLLGFGSGQYYSEGWISGSAFLAIDIASISLAGYGIATANKDDDEEEFGDSTGNALVGGMALTYGGIALLVSHAAQAILGPIWADHYNVEMMKEGKNNIKAFVTPDDDSVVLGLAWSF